MPYQTRDDLPESVRHVLPVHAQDIFKEAFNSAIKEYQDPKKRRDNSSPEQVAFRVAWSAVEKLYHKDENGKWVAK
ncbi:MULTISPECIES: ChaB family protein [unclassified Gilliamella]|uniref:ChaB family protein n=1 Tax=unclassified Gilliamella TaxID=2685620 RepID=UPI00226A83AE|nr:MULTISPECIES: ChaB family protein [unclassified Gilliamella]MCX8583341.1 ChaB family protein [Gilliamella sp. B3372]MCX8585003.1 ChaB family protein [Gilliamella sp. B3562]MCX8593760.1 ChaB family protein [Gilliamella sp. B3367]MCX8659364.1 ChaB family protein [Gilliamella sp. B2772]MCX8662838.1 ChaB family protein [Gilliamella sp. B2911]